MLFTKQPTDAVSWLGNSEPTAMKHYAMATDEAFKAASDPTAQTVTRVQTKDVTASGSSYRFKPSASGAIQNQKDKTASVDLSDETQCFIVQDNAGGFYLVGLAGLEPAT